MAPRGRKPSKKIEPESDKSDKSYAKNRFLILPGK